LIVRPRWARPRKSESTDRRWKWVAQRSVT